MILLKPTLIQSDRQWEQDLAETRGRCESAAAAPGREQMNYLKHFGLREMPFGITPDTSFFFGYQSIQEALNTLLIAVANGEGFIKITGEVGTGKTLLCRKFLSTLGPNWVTAYLPNPKLEPRTLLLALAEDLGVSGRRHRSPAGKGVHAPAAAHRAAGPAGGAVHGRDAGDAAAHAGDGAPAHEPRDREAQAPPGRAFRTARARPQARIRVGAAAAPAHHVPVHPEGTDPQGSRRLRRAPPHDRGLYRTGTVQHGGAQGHPYAEAAASRAW